jgi:hypothetical protein
LTARPATRTVALGARPQISEPSVNAAIPSEHAAAAVEIGEHARREQQARVDEIVGVDHTLQRSHAGVEPGADLLDGEIDDRRVDLRDQHAERHRQQDQRCSVRDARSCAV